MKLTSKDRMILESYKTTLEGLANYLGSSYEFVLHSLENLDHSVIKILNGYHTGRTIGSPITNLALDMLEQIDNDKNGSDYFSYFSNNRNNEPLKSSTIAIRGENNRIIGLLCINCYLNTPYLEILKSMGLSIDQNIRSEDFKDNFEDNIEQIVKEVKVQISKNKTIPPSQLNKTIIAALYKKNVFKIKNSIEIVAKELGISINTVYLHLRNMEN